MDKVIYLLDNEVYSEQDVRKLTRKDLEKWVAQESYDDDYTIMKVDANDYDSVEEALEAEGLEADGYHVIAFGF